MGKQSNDASSDDSSSDDDDIPIKQKT